MSDAVQHFSLWLMPSKESALHTKVQGVINQLADTYAAPVFPPHVTLLGGLLSTKEEVLRRTEELAKTIAPYHVEFDAVKPGPLYFQCVFIKCKETPDVMAAFEAAKKEFEVDPDTTYMPHLSLLYSNIAFAEKEARAAKAQDALFGDGETSELMGAGFDATHLAVWETSTAEGAMVQDWEQIAIVPLRG